MYEYTYMSHHYCRYRHIPDEALSTQPILIGMGILMMYIAYEGSWINAILDESQSTGVLVL